jgi:ELWxxDGT repeat protein
MRSKKGRGSASATRRFVEALEERTLLAGVLLKDINTATASSSPQNLATLGTSLLFFADDGIVGRELWKLDGGVATRLTNTLSANATPGPLVRMNDLMYFAVDAAGFRQIWRTDGTAANTFPITNNLTSQASAMSIGNPVVVGQSLFFETYDANGVRLWKTAGTAAGQEQLVKTFPTSSAFPAFIDFNGTLFFGANDGVHGSQLWKSDGTDAGTVMVKVIPTAPNSGAAGSFPNYLTLMGGVLYLRASNELWRTDGTEAGTLLVKQINTNLNGSSNVQSIVTTGSRLYFSAASSAGNNELWQSDGTELGTTLVKEIRPGTAGSSPASLTVANDLLYFTANDGTNGTEVWRSDGTAEGTFMLADATPGAVGSNPGGLRAIGQSLYFGASSTGGYELWKSDGTTAGTARLKDIYPGTNSSGPAGFTELNGLVYFSAAENFYGTEMWRTDGSEAGTRLEVDINTLSLDSNIGSMTQSNGIVYFVATSAEAGAELWKTDGTPQGTQLVKDIYPGPNSSSPSGLFDVAGTLFFNAYTAAGQALWKSDGTESGTVQVSTHSMYYIGSRFEAALGHTFFYVSNDPASDTELWKSDGTPGGTVMVKDINTSPTWWFDYPEGLIAYKGRIFFVQTNDQYRRVMWSTDGTAAGTVLLEGINSGEENAFFTQWPVQPVIYKEELYFGANTAQYGPELWSTDGTRVRMIYDSNPTARGYGLLQHDLTVSGNNLFMGGDDDVHGDELWISSVNGTRMVQDIFPGVSASRPSGLTDVDGVLYFVATDGTHGRELYRSDGTNSGTWLVKDIVPGSADSTPSTLRGMQGRVWFYARKQGQLSGLWVSDGTPDRTLKLMDSRGATNDAIATFNGDLYFVGYDPAVGGELYKIPAPAARAGGPYAVVAGHSITLDGSASSGLTAEDPLSYTWDLDGDGIFGETASAAANGDEIGPTPTFRAYNIWPGAWTVRLRITDSNHMPATVSATISVGIPDFMVLSPGAVIAWEGVPGNAAITLHSGSLTLNGDIGDVYPNMPLYVLNAASVFINVDQNLNTLLMRNSSRASMASGVVLGAYLGMSDSSRIDIGDGRVVGLANFDSLYDKSLLVEDINAGRIISSAVQADSRLAIAVYPNASRRLIIEEALLGDLNVDGQVSISDFIDLSSNFGKTNSFWREGDLNGDYRVTIADFITLAANFGQTYSPGVPQAPAASAVTLSEQKNRRRLKRGHVHHRRAFASLRHWWAASRRWVAR